MGASVFVLGGVPNSSQSGYFLFLLFLVALRPPRGRSSCHPSIAKLPGTLFNLCISIYTLLVRFNPMSLSSPPPYSSYASTSGSSSSSGSRKLSRKHRPDTSHDQEKDTTDIRSIASGHSGSTARTQMSSRSDTLKMAIRTDLADKKGPKVVRRARCTPEFLEEIAKTGVPHNFKTRADSSFKVVYGLEAEALFDHFLGLVGSCSPYRRTLIPVALFFSWRAFCSFVVTLAVVNSLRLSVWRHVGVLGFSFGCSCNTAN